jgi:hypothetical protein
LRGLFCTYEKTAVAAEYSEIVGLEEVEVFLPLTRLPISDSRQFTRTICANNFDCTKKDARKYKRKRSREGSAHTHKKEKFETDDAYTFS